jgi:NAD+ diphosphatase
LLDELTNKRLYVVEISTEIIAEQDHYSFLPIRKLLQTLNPELFHLVCKAKQLLNWHKISRFCGACGHLTQLSQTEVAKICQNCQRIHYPFYSPAVMVLIERDNEILLARSPHFTQGVYSALAGFIAPAESAEEAVVREVTEEVGIKISDIKYFGTQNWPFPNSFMLAYTARYVSGDICAHDHELEDARWFNLSALPLLPSLASISRHLIDDFIRRKSKRDF